MNISNSKEYIKICEYLKNYYNLISILIGNYLSPCEVDGNENM